MTTTRDGRTLHVERHGVGPAVGPAAAARPIVVFESGLGASRNEWGAVVAAIADRATAVVYDRSGLGRSPAADGPRNLDHLTADLLDVLADLGDGPFVLVGHSWGGPVVRSAAAALAPTRPHAIAGLVLVDQSDERCDLFFGKGNLRQLRWAPKVLPLTAKLGVVRRLVKGLAKHLPEPWATAMVQEDGTAAAIGTQLAELRSHVDDLRRLRDRPLVLPDVPVVVISGTRNGFGEKGRRPALVEAHAATAAALPQGRHVRADRSSHYVPFTEPELVAAEILGLVDGADHR